MKEVDWKELPTQKKLIVKFQGNETLTLEIDQDYELVYIYIGNDKYYCTDLIKIKDKITNWSTIEEKPKEKGSRVYLDFSESELEELQGLLSLSQNYLDVTDLRDWKYKEEIIKKFQDKFSKVEF